MARPARERNHSFFVKTKISSDAHCPALVRPNSVSGVIQVTQQVCVCVAHSVVSRVSQVMCVCVCVPQRGDPGDVCVFVSHSVVIQVMCVCVCVPQRGDPGDVCVCLCPTAW